MALQFFTKTDSNYNRPFDLGKIIITQCAAVSIFERDIDLTQILKKHTYGDWSHMSKWYQESNVRALKEGGYIVSTVHLNNVQLVITTHNKKCITTVAMGFEVHFNPFELL